MLENGHQKKQLFQGQEDLTMKNDYEECKISPSK